MNAEEKKMKQFLVDEKLELEQAEARRAQENAGEEAA
jgi:hypothetical protein